MNNVCNDIRSGFSAPRGSPNINCPVVGSIGPYRPFAEVNNFPVVALDPPSRSSTGLVNPLTGVTPGGYAIPYTTLPSTHPVTSLIGNAAIPLIPVPAAT